jgi:hypothetical protein
MIIDRKKAEQIKEYIAENLENLAALAWKGYLAEGRGAIVDKDGKAFYLAQNARPDCLSEQFAQNGHVYPSAREAHWVQTYDPHKAFVYILVHPDGGSSGYHLQPVPGPPETYAEQQAEVNTEGALPDMMPAVCDFCCERPPVKYFECPSFPLEFPGLDLPSELQPTSLGDWAACSECAALVESEDHAAIVEHGLRKCERLVGAPLSVDERAFYLEVENRNVRRFFDLRTGRVSKMLEL